MFALFEYKIVHQPIEIDSVTYESYAEINLFNKYGNILRTLNKKIIDFDSIVKQYQDSKEIILDNCFVKDFDIQKISENKIELKRISASNAVFISENEINFSNITSIEENICFNNAYFLKGKVNFNNSSLGNINNDFSNAYFFSGEVDFTNCVFGSGENCFSNSYFGDGNKNFQYANFNAGTADFVNVNFGIGNVFFINANFTNSSVSFKSSFFGDGKVDFHYAHFGKTNSSFEQIYFGVGGVDFSKVTIGGGKLNFNRSIFVRGEIDFEGLELKNSKITFKKTHFSDNTCVFNEAECHGTIINFDFSVVENCTFSFRNAVVKDLSFVSVHLNNYCDFRVKHLEKLNLQDCVVRDIIDFIPFKTPVLIERINIYGLRLVGKIFIDWNRNSLKSMVYKYEDNSYDVFASQFRVLKENFHNTGEYNAEDMAYVEFKRCESLASLECSSNKKNKFSKFSHKLFYYFEYIFLDKAGLYGTSPVRVMLSMLATYVFFSLSYLILQLLEFGSFTLHSGKDLWSMIADSFYFSIVTYLTIGYGDLSPIGMNRFLAGLEGFVGVFLMAYFSVAFVRRILR